MKTTKSVLTVGLFAIILIFSGCAKDGNDGINGINGSNGSAGVNGINGADGIDGTNGSNGSNGSSGTDGLDARSFNFSLTFDQTTDFDGYFGVVGFDANDIIIVYEEVGIGNGTWRQMSFTSVGVSHMASFDDSGNVFISTKLADGTTGSPWGGAITFSYKAVLVKGQAMQDNPNVDYSNYEEVKTTFDL